jgi:stringent starvation protein B
MTLMGNTTSTKPYLIRALHEWCNDNGVTPYIVVAVDSTVDVPKESVRNGEVVLNISIDATSGLLLNNDYISFKARFGGVPRDIVVPIGRVVAIYGRETGEGMSFPVERFDAEDLSDGFEQKLSKDSRKAASLVRIDGGAGSGDGAPMAAENLAKSTLLADSGDAGKGVSSSSIPRVALTRIK